MQNLHILPPDGKKYQTQFYNLDAIISVGYRVNSNRGTQFRQWATKVLRDHLVQGFTVNRTRLAEKGISEMQQAVELLARTLDHQALITGIGKDVLSVIVGYAKTWRLLLQYDEATLLFPQAVNPPAVSLNMTLQGRRFSKSSRTERAWRSYRFIRV